MRPVFLDRFDSDQSYGRDLLGTIVRYILMLHTMVMLQPSQLGMASTSNLCGQAVAESSSEEKDGKTPAVANGSNMVEH
jgi:hypothetical protein